MTRWRRHSALEENQAEAPVAATQKVSLVQGQRGGLGPGHGRPDGGLIEKRHLVFLGQKEAIEQVFTECAMMKFAFRRHSFIHSFILLEFTYQGPSVCRLCPRHLGYSSARQTDILPLWAGR